MPQSGEYRNQLMYFAFGPFCLESDIELFELPVSSGAGIPILLRHGAAPAQIQNPLYENEFWMASGSEFRLSIPGVATYYVHSGSEIIVDPAPGGLDLDIRAFLLGNVFAVLCLQRGLLPLHASAVRLGRGTVAFLGNSGAGKSTLAAYLAQAGFPLVSDDICLLDPSAPLESRVLPITPWLKLWPNSLEVLGQSAAGLPQTYSDENKFRLSSRHLHVVQESAVPLAAILVLERLEEAEDGSCSAQLQPLSPFAMMMRMMEFTYQRYMIDVMGIREKHFQQCGQCLEGAQGFVLRRSWRLECLPQIADVLRNLALP